MNRDAASHLVDEIVAIYKEAARQSSQHLALADGIVEAWVWPLYARWLKSGC